MPRPWPGNIARLKALQFPPWFPVAIFVFLHVIDNNAVNAGVPRTPGGSAIVEAVKLGISVAYHPWGNVQPQSRPGSSDEEQPLSDLRPTMQRDGSERVETTTIPSLGKGTIVLMGAIAIVQAYYDQLLSITQVESDPLLPFFVVSLGALLSMVALHCFLMRSFCIAQWQAVALQLCGLFIIKVRELNVSTTTTPIYFTHRARSSPLTRPRDLHPCTL
ncbi:hypothetical protein JAAARDRAFT_459312 [Jaapia argillacea MUCL 33604]|uniref:Uncharacterized protein n=1 Tax=Jaapia argillacea MUCL 33604 TaxID=933084 RepID=A0A067Q5S3_9AGAM|nr:hypothetical protein JAAARDRAFT_459312 [Jaapia argillacea MUCL 33604]